MTAHDHPPHPAQSGATQDSEADPASVPHVALSTVRGRPPSKVFATKSLSARSLMGTTKIDVGTLRERLHGKAPMVKWPKPTSRNAVALPTPTPKNEQPDAAPVAQPVEKGLVEKRGVNMSERFIAERLLSDRGGSAFNPQIPRRVPDIPSPGSVKSS